MKKTWKNRLLSGLLALTMLAAYLPAGLVTPASAAVYTGGVLTIDDSGHFTVTFQGGAGTTSNYALAVIPDVSSNPANVPSLVVGTRLNASHGGDASFKNSFNSIGAPNPDTYYYTTGSEEQWHNGTLTLSGQLNTTALATALNQENGKSKVGGTVSTADEELPMIAVLWTTTGPHLCSATGVWRQAGHGELTADPLHIEVKYKQGEQWKVNNVDKLDEEGSVKITLKNTDQSETFTFSTSTDISDTGAFAAAIGSMDYTTDYVYQGGIDGSNDAGSSGTVRVLPQGSGDNHDEVKWALDLNALETMGFTGSETITIKYYNSYGVPKGTITINITLINEGGWLTHDINESRAEGYSGSDAELRTTFEWKGDPGTTWTPSGYYLQDGSNFETAYGSYAFKLTKPGGGDVDIDNAFYEQIDPGEYTICFKLNQGLSAGTYTDMIQISTDEGVVGVIHIYVTITPPVEPTTTHTVTFNDNESIKPTTNTNSVESMPEPASVADGNSISWNDYGASDPPTLKGYTFKGWSTTSGASNDSNIVLDSSNLTYSPTDNETLYAVWTPNSISLDNVIYDVQNGNTLQLSSGNGQARSTPSDHTAIDFTYYAAVSPAGGSYTEINDSGSCVTDSSSLVEVKVQSNAIIANYIGVSQSITSQIVFDIKAKSKLNNQEAEATLTIRTPPEIDGAHVSGALKPGESVTLDKVTLTNTSALENNSASGTEFRDTSDPSGSTLGAVTVLEWALGNASTDHLTGEPYSKSTFSSSSVTVNATIPSYAADHQYLWVKLRGDGTHISNKDVWCRLGEITVNKNTVTAKVIIDGDSDHAQNPPVPGVTINPSSATLSAGENATFYTNPTDAGYKFKGWSLDGSMPITGTNGPLAVSGSSATYTMPTLAADDEVYAHYIGIPVLGLSGTNGTGKEGIQDPDSDPKVHVENNGHGDAELTVELESGSDYDNDKFTIDETGSNLHTGSSVPKDGSGDIVLKPDGALPPGTYTVEVTVKYQQDDELKTETQLVTYTVKKAEYTLKVKNNTGVASSTVKVYCSDSGSSPSQTIPVSTTNTETEISGVHSDDVITIDSSYDAGYQPSSDTYTGSTANYHETTENRDLNTPSSFVTFRIDGDVTVTVNAENTPAKVTLSPKTPGSGTYDTGNSTFTHVTPAEVTAENIGGTAASVTKVEITHVTATGDYSGVSSSDFTITNAPDPSDSLVKSGEGGNSKNYEIKGNPNNLTAGTYTLTVQLTYTGDGGDHPATTTVTTTVTYVVSAVDTFTGKVTVKLDGSPMPSGATVTVDGGSVSGQEVSNLGEVSVPGLSAGQSYTVTVDYDGAAGGVYQAVEAGQLSIGSRELTVEFYTITVKLANSSPEQGATGNGGTVTTSVNGTTLTSGPATNTVNSGNLLGNSLEGVFLKNSVVTINVPSFGSNYLFDHWDKTVPSASNVATSASYNFQVTGKEEYTAHLKENFPAVVTYMGNYNQAPGHDTNSSPYIAVPNSDVKPVGTSYTIPSDKPNLPGYKFTGWSKNSNGPADPTYAPGVGVTLDGDVLDEYNHLTLYAIWDNATIDLSVTDTERKGVYGSTYNNPDPILASSTDSNGQAVALKYAVTGANKLPGGLELDENTGRVFGRPFQVGPFNDIEITVTLAQDYHDAGSKVKAVSDPKYKVTVDKMKPTVTQVQLNGSAIPGSNVDDASYTVTVTGLRLKAGANTPNVTSDDEWDAYTDTLVYTNTSTKDSGIGSASFTFSGDDGDKFPASGDVTVKVHFEPQPNGTSGDGSTDFDDHEGNKQDTVWDEAEGSGTVSPAQTYGLTIDPQGWSWSAHEGYTVGTNSSPNDGAVTFGPPTDAVNMKDFTLKNTGNTDTGTLTMSWTTNGYFTLDNTNTDPLSAGDTRTITVKVNQGLAKLATPYSDTLTITDSTNGTSVQIHLDLYVLEKYTFTAQIKVETNAVGGSLPGKQLSDMPGVGLKLVPIWSASGAIDVTINEDMFGTDKYTVDGLVSGMAYRLVATNTGGGEYDTGVVVNSPNPETVQFYQITLGEIDQNDHPLTLTSPAGSQRGAGWYVKDQSAEIGNYSSGTSSGTTYVFAGEAWKTGTNPSYDPTSYTTNPFTLPQVTVAAQYNAVYKEQDAEEVTLTYEDNVDGTIRVPAAQTAAKADGEYFTVDSYKPHRDGYSFVGWSTDRSRDPSQWSESTHNGEDFAPNSRGPKKNNDATLYAIWDKGKVLPPGGGSDNTTWNVILPNGVYGTNYVYTVPKPETTDGAGVTFSAPGLPGGLTIDPDTGVITGRPYEMANEKEVTIIATHNYWNGEDDHSPAVTMSKTVKITIEKYKLQLRDVSVTGVIFGQSANTATYEATVVDAPIWKDGQWDTPKFTETVTLTNGVPGAGKGKLSLDPSSSSSTFSNSPISVTLNYAPSTSEMDGKGNKHNEIYEPATATVKASAGSGTYTMKVSEEHRNAPNEGRDITMQGPDGVGFKATNVGYTVDNAASPANGSTSANKINAQEFELTNTGNQSTGTLSYRFGTANTADEAGDYFEISGAFFPSPLGPSGGGSDSGTFTVVPKISLAPGTYTDTLTITNGGGYTVSIILKLTVEAERPAVTVTTELWDVGESSKKDPVSAATGFTVELKRVDTTGGPVPLTEGSTSGQYGVFTGNIEYAGTYQITVNGYTVPDVYIQGNAPATLNQTVTMYQVKVADDPSSGATSADSKVKNSSGSKEGASIYVVKGENATVTRGDEASGYKYKELRDTTSVPDSQVTTGDTYTTAIEAAKAYTAYYGKKVTLKYATKSDDTSSVSGNLPDSEEHTQGEAVRVKGNTNPSPMTREGYTFTGWATSDAGAMEYAPGAEYTMTGDETQTLYACWEPVDQGLYLPDKSYTAYYGEEIEDHLSAVNGGSGNLEYTWDKGGSSSVPDDSKWDTHFDIATDGTVSGKPGVMTGSSGGVQKYEKGPFELSVEVENTDTHEKSPKATYTVTVEKSRTEIDPGSAQPKSYDEHASTGGPHSDGKFYPGDTLNPNDFIDGVNVDAMKHTDDVGTSAHDVIPGSTALDGTWSIEGDMTIPDSAGGGEITVKLRFKPNDEGFEDTVVEVTVYVTKKEITSVDVGIHFPKDGNQPDPGYKNGTMQQAKASVPAATTPPLSDPTDTLNSTTTPTVSEVVEVTEVKWTHGASSEMGDSDTFDMAHNDVDVVVTLTAQDNWVFSGELEGKFININSDNSGETETAQVLHVSPDGKTAVLRYRWVKEDAQATNIKVRVTEPVAGMTPDNYATPVGTPAVSLDIQSVEWIELDSGKSLNDVTSANYTSPTGVGQKMNLAPLGSDTFQEEKKYVVIVTVKEADGYDFDWSGGGIATLNSSSEYATINGSHAKVLKRDDSDKVVVLAIELETKAATVNGILSVTGTLEYYLNTESGASAGDKHHDTTATGHNGSYGFTLDRNTFAVEIINNLGHSDTTHTDFFLFVDTNSDGKYTHDSDLLADTSNPTYTFLKRNGDDSLDGKDLYVAYVAGGRASGDISIEEEGTVVRKVGKLVVKPLKAENIQITSGGIKLERSGGNITFSEQDNTKAAVDFNTGDPMAYRASDLTWNSGSEPTPVRDPADRNDTRPNYYYMLDADDDGDITDSDTKLTTNHNIDFAANKGKDIYICYTDVNGNLVYTKVGTLFTVGITDPNGGDKEYGDKLTATPDPGDGSYSYQWQRWVPDREGGSDTPGASGGHWAPIPGAVSKDYTPGAEDVEKYLRVEATDTETGTTQPSDHVKVEKRSLNFTVERHNKEYDGDAKNKHEYTAEDFTLKGVSASQGGVMPGDEVSLKPAAENDWNTEDNRPSFAGKEVGNTITWPAVSESGDVSKKASKLTDYELDGKDKNCYRLVGQGAQTERGEITEKGKVTHVDVSFDQKPAAGLDIPTVPTKVTDKRETTDESGGENFTATWYELNSGDTFDPSNPDNGGSRSPASGQFAFGKSYVVVVKVKPNSNNGYTYDENTKFYFHFAQGDTPANEVTKVGAGTATDGVYESGGVYMMFYTFKVEAITVAHVTVSTFQPANGENVPSDTDSVKVIQTLGDNGKKVTDVTVSDVKWSQTSGSATQLTPTSDKFSAGETYSVEFKLTTPAGYVYQDADEGVTFVVNGLGPILKANTPGGMMPGSGAVTKVTTVKDSDTVYKVTVDFAAVPMDKAALTDVYVIATPAAVGEKKGSDEPKVEPNKPYVLTGSDNKWQYWDKDSGPGGAWVDASENNGLGPNGEFLPGHDYQVTATVKLTEDGAKKYQITDGNNGTTATQFYLAGEVCTTSENTDATKGNYKELAPSTTAGDGVYASDATFTLTKRFHIPEEAVTEIYVNYIEPVAGQMPRGNKISSGDDSKVDITDPATWYKLSLSSAPVDGSSFNDISTRESSSFASGTYYMVSTTIKGKPGIVIDGDTYVTINGIRVKADGQMGTKSSGSAIGWAVATYDGGQITVKYIAKTEDAETTDVLSVQVFFNQYPALGNTIPSAPDAVHNETETLSESDNTDYTAKWYYRDTSSTSYTTNFDPAHPTNNNFVDSTESSFGQDGIGGGDYVVTVKVKPNSNGGYAYNGTRFFFNFGGQQNIEVTRQTGEAASGVYENGGVYMMFYTFHLGYWEVLPPHEHPGEDISNKLTGTYYLKTGTTDKHHQENLSSDNTPTPGGKQAIGFTLDVTTKLTVTSAAIEVQKSDGTTVPLVLNENTGTGPERHYRSGANEEGWQLVVGSSAADAVPLGETFDNGTSSFVKTFEGAANQTPSAAETWNGKKVYLKVGGTVIDKELGTLTVVELTAESIDATATSGSFDGMLEYTITSNNSGVVNPKFTTAGIQSVSVSFNRDVTYTTADGLAAGDTAAADGTKYYFQINNGTSYVDLVNNVTEITAGMDGNPVYICYTDVNGHVVRKELGKLKVNSTADVVVETTVPPVAGENPVAPSVDGDRPYELDTSSGDNKWEKKDSSSWSALGSTAFAAGNTYRVTATVKVKAGENFVINDSTRFWLGGVLIPRDHPGDWQALSGVANAKTYFKVNSDSSGTTYTIGLEYTLPPVKIAHVNVSVNQPVVSDSASAGNYTDVLEIQILGDDGSNQSDHVTSSAVTWHQGNSESNWEMGTFSGTFALGKWYKAEFDLTTTDPYKYWNKSADPADDDDVAFIISGVGPFNGVQTEDVHTTRSTIYSVETSSDSKDTTYHVTVIFKQLTAEKTDPLVVVVDASQAVKDVVKTGPTVDSNRPYMLDTEGTNKWQYWDGSGWADVDAPTGKGLSTDGKFLRDTDYRVTAQVKLKDGSKDHYQITTSTKFYLAGLECKLGNNAADDPTGHEPGGKYTQLAPSVAAGGTVYGDDVTYKLEQRFHIPADDIFSVTVDYDRPVSGAMPGVYDTYTDTTQVDLAKELKDESTRESGTGTTWYADTVKETTTVSSTPDVNITAFGDTDYTVVTTFKAKPGYCFTEDTSFVVNGIRYTKKTDGDQVRLSDYGKTATVWHTFKGLNKVVAQVITNVSAPAAKRNLQANANTTYVANAENVTLTKALLENNGKSAITWTPGGNAASGAADYATTYTATFKLTVDTDNGYSYRGGEQYVDFNINGVELNVKNDASAYTTVTVLSSTSDPNADWESITLTKNDDNKTYTVTIKFKPTEVYSAKLTDVRIAAAQLPKVGETSLPVSIQNPLAKVYEATKDGSGKENLHWQKKVGTDWVNMDPSDAFEAGVEYRVYGQVTLKNTGTIRQDYDITRDTGFYIDIGGHEVFIAKDASRTVTVDSFSGCETGFTATTTPAADGIYNDDTVYTITLAFPALTEESDKVIVKVAANVKQPVKNNPITSDVDVWLAWNQSNEDMRPGVTSSNVQWESSSDGLSGWNTASGTFQEGIFYRVSFDLEAKTDDGYSFLADALKSDYVDFLINGIQNPDGSCLDGEGNITRGGVTVSAAKKDGSNDKYTITVTFSEVSDKANVLSVFGLVDEPRAAYTIDKDTQIKALDSEPYEKVDSLWEVWDDSTGTWQTATGTFQAGKRYRATLTVEIKSGQASLWQFYYSSPTDKTEGYINGYGEHEGTTVTYVTGTGTTEHPQQMTLTREFTVPLERIPIVEVNSPAPKAGETLPTDINPPAGAKYHFDDKAWSGELTEDGKAKSGATYTLTVTVVPEEGCELPGDDEIYYWWNNTEGGGSQQADNVTVTENDDGNYTATFTYTIPEETAQPKDGVVYVEPPVKGETPKDAASPNDSVKIEDTKWTDSSGNELGPDDKFQSGESYTAHVTINPEKPDGTGEWKSGDHVNVNGQDAEIKEGEGGELYVELKWTLPDDTVVHQGSGGTTTNTVESPVVYYHLKDQGVTDDPTAEKVKKNASPKNVPKVKALEGLKFLGWSEVDPSTLPAGQLPTLVDPTTFKITKDKWFYAVYEQGVEVDHTHYVIGFPNGTFAPDAKITRAEVATIIARSCLEGFVEGANYGNPGNYSDVSTHWAFSAISYCARAGVFNGYEDGTFRPDRYITRQELATVVARLAGIQTSQGVPFVDADQIASWAANGVYTAYANGWVNGYEDNTFLPERDVSRAETVKIFNGYLNRGVTSEGLEGLKEYVHTGVASNNRQNDKDEYMTWPDVPKTHWAYYEIIEAANDHNYHWMDEEKQTPPEDWDEVYIDEKWRYNDNAEDGADRRDENMNAQKTFTVTYLVSSNGVTYDAITETVERFASPKPENMPIAVPNPGYRFVGWSTTDPSTGTVTLVDPTASSVTSDKWFYAVFEEDTPYTLPVYTVTYVIGSKGSYDGATVEKVEMYQSPSVSGLPHPTANPGYRCVGWSETDPDSGSYTLVDPTANYVTGDKTFYAVYEAL